MKEPTTCTQKEEAFACAVAEGNSYSDAYRIAYDVGINTQQSTIWEEASRIANSPHVTARINELQAVFAEMVGYSFKDAMEELDKSFKLARKAVNPSAMIQAVRGKMRLTGLDRPTVAKDTESERLTDPDEIIDKFISMLPMVEPYLEKHGITFIWSTEENN